MSLLLGFQDQHRMNFGKNSTLFLFLGMALVILGIVAMSAATFTTLASVIFLGCIIFLSGLVLLIDTFTFWRGKWGGFLLHLLFALLYIVVGFWLVENPIAGSVSITFILGVFYVVLGIFRLTFSPLLRAPVWGWSWLNGIITLCLGILILTSWPSSSLFIIGLFIGIDLLFAGIAYVMWSLAAKRIR